MVENDAIFGKKVITDAGESTNLKAGQIVSARDLRDENSLLRRNDLTLVQARDAQPATAVPILQGITRLFANSKLDFGGFLPGNYQSAQRSSSARKSRYFIGLERKRNCRVT